MDYRNGAVGTRLGGVVAHILFAMEAPDLISSTRLRELASPFHFLQTAVTLPTRSARKCLRPQKSSERPHQPQAEQHSRGVSHAPFPTDPPPHAPPKVGTVVVVVVLPCGRMIPQCSTEDPHQPHSEQHSWGSGHIPFPTNSSPQVATGIGAVGGRKTIPEGGEAVGAGPAI
jgi:hypothetical protein